MKVLWLTNIPSPYRVDFFNQIGKKVELTVLFERGNASNREKSWGKTEFDNFNAVELIGKSVGSDNAICPSVVKWLNKEYDRIIITNYSSPTAMLAINYMNLKNIPFSIEADGGILKQDESRIMKNIKKYLISSADYWFSSGEITDQYFEYYGALPDKIIRFHFSSLHEDEIIKSPLSMIEKRNHRMQLLNNDLPTAIAVGRFIKSKNFDSLIKAWKKVDRNYQLLLIGSGPEKEKYLKIIVENEISNIKILDFKNKKELFKYYKISDLFILPTLEDVWGLVINEAMACGLPILTTHGCVAGVEMISTGENGDIFEPFDEEELIKLINKYMSNSDLQNSSSKKSIEIIKKYTIENMVQEHVEAFEKM